MEPTDRIFIVHKKSGPRLSYIAGFLSDSLGIDFVLTHETVNPGPFIIYGDSTETGGIHIPESGFMSEESIREFIPIVETKEQVLLFPVAGEYDMPFDIFSALFYFLSRYEEYLPYEGDRLGRFEIKQSFSYRKGFQMEPVVDQWLMMLSGLLHLRFPGLKLPLKKFRFISTFDIDSPWAFKNRRIGRNLPGLAMNFFKGKYSDFLERWKVILNRGEDPFDVYYFIHQVEDQYSFHSLFFFLLANNGRIDPNYSLHSAAFKNLIRGLSEDHGTGIHPSFHSNADNNKLKDEIFMFRSFTGRMPEMSRQHYLMLKFPDTYHRLIKHGIKDDYSMGYASGLGFRAGTTLPFRFYDLKAEKQTDLIVHPFTVMDVTLMQYMQMDAEQAIRAITELIEKIRNVNGIFMSLWHNESLSEWGNWKGWRRVFVEMVKKAVC